MSSSSCPAILLHLSAAVQISPPLIFLTCLPRSPNPHTNGHTRTPIFSLNWPRLNNPNTFPGSQLKEPPLPWPGWHNYWGIPFGPKLEYPWPFPFANSGKHRLHEWSPLSLRSGAARCVRARAFVSAPATNRIPITHINEAVGSIWSPTKPSAPSPGPGFAPLLSPPPHPSGGRPPGTPSAPPSRPLVDRAKGAGGGWRGGIFLQNGFRGGRESSIHLDRNFPPEPFLKCVLHPQPGTPTG